MAIETQAASEAGPCEPADTEVASTSGTCSSAQAIVLSQATSSSMSGGEDIVRQAMLSASPQAAAIARIVLRDSPPNGLETTIGLRVPRSIAANCATSTLSLGTSSGSPIDITKSMLGSSSATAAARVTSAARARRRSPVVGSETYRQSGPDPK